MTTQEIIAAYLGGMTGKQIALLAGISHGAVCARLRRARVRKRTNDRATLRTQYPRWAVDNGTSVAAHAVLAALAGGPATADDLAQRLHYADATVAIVLRALRRLRKVISVHGVWSMVTGGIYAKTLD